jgi:tRNA (cytidine32/uridine32-2'-O)-methyltransferase
MSQPVVQHAPKLDLLGRIRIVMVNTTLSANIGAAARAMKTMGLSDLVLVDPKAFPHGDATALASGAADVLESARVVATLDDAIADCALVFGTSARSRTIPWPLLDVRPATNVAVQEAGQNHQVAIVFGREDRGLTNDELALCQYHLTIPVNPTYGVLNVAAAIQVVSYELRMHALANVTSTDSTTAHAIDHSDHLMPVMARMDWDEPVVDQASMQQFYQHFEATLADMDFMDPNNPRLLPLRIKRLFGRVRLDRMEYNLLRGIFGRMQAISRGAWPPANLKAARSQSTDPTASTPIKTAENTPDA